MELKAAKGQLREILLGLLALAAVIAFSAVFYGLIELSRPICKAPLTDIMNPEHPWCISTGFGP